MESTAKGRVAPDGVRYQICDARLKQKIHTIHMELLIISSARMIQHMWDAREGLKGATLDIADLFCPSGCCRTKMVELWTHAVEHLGHMHEWELAESNVSRDGIMKQSGFRVVGFFDERERERVRKAL